MSKADRQAKKILKKARKRSVEIEKSKSRKDQEMGKQ